MSNPLGEHKFAGQIYGDFCAGKGLILKKGKFAELILPRLANFHHAQETKSTPSVPYYKQKKKTTLIKKTKT